MNGLSLLNKPSELKTMISNVMKKTNSSVRKVTRFIKSKNLKEVYAVINHGREKVEILISKESINAI
jgi:hypothetical protein